MKTKTNGITQQGRVMTGDSKTRIKIFEDRIEKLKKEGKLDQEDLMDLKGIKRECERLVRSKNFDCHGGKGSLRNMTEDNVYESVPWLLWSNFIGAPIAIPWNAIYNYGESGWPGVMKTLLVSPLAPVAGIAIGCMALAGSINKNRAKKEYFNHLYDKKMEGFYNLHLSDKTQKLNATK